MRSSASIVLTAALALGGLTSTAAAGPADLSIVPEAGTMLLHVDFARLRGSALYKDVVMPMLQTPNAKKEIDEVKQKLGFDPTTDIDGLTVVMPAVGPGSDQAVVVLEGKVNQAKLEEMAKTEGKATKADYNGVAIWVGKDGEKGKEMAVAFLGNRTALGSADLVRGLIDATKAPGNQMGAQLAGLTKKADQGGDVWFAATVPAAAKMGLAQGNPMAKDIDHVVGSFDFAKGLKMNVTLGATKAAVDAMAQMAQGALKEANAEQGKNPMFAAMGIGPMLEKLKVEAKGTDLVASMDLNEQDVGRLKAMVGMIAAMQNAAAMQAPPGAGMPGAPPPGAAPVSK